MTTVLLTGFEPFGNDATNPSGDAVRQIANRCSGPETLVTEVLPVAYAASGARLRELIAEHSPDIVIATGLAGNRPTLGFERVAVNLRDARIPDNAGDQPVDTAIIEGGPSAHFTTLPVKAMARAVAEAGIATELSMTAGTFVCNDVFYTAVDAAPAGTKAGFIHVPWNSEDVPGNFAAMPLEQIIEGVTIAVRTAIATSSDATYAAGTLS